MEQLKKLLDSFFVWVLKLAMVLLVAMVVLVFLNVVLRYGFSSGVYWSEEISLVIVIWFTFISMALGVKESLHINVDILPKKLPKAFFTTLECLRDALIVLIGGIMVFYGWKLTLNGAKSFLPATHIPNSINYLVLPVSGVFIILYASIHLYEDILKFKGGNAK
ncbi:TRAP transporter small permease [Sphaerochaeta sp. PS]|uniref:TRAP transporter small permease n=1 Tax=Sphaerochaeta sp. PS TaxID=3076336 RepID=UPI0028A3B0AF|nr:TRAP transporter small permease [Sphaerochaeta sp. PS]MDT4763061.1 TRAP transporter small permease [Sphaerochaeta sp. PS]